MDSWTVTTLDRQLGAALVPWEHWVHRTGQPVRKYLAQSRADADALCALLNSCSAEQFNNARKAALEPQEIEHAA